MLEISAIKIKISELAVAIEKQQPNYISLLQTVHKELALQPELNYKLADEEISVIVSGLSAYHKEQITEPKSKKPVNKKQGSMLSADDV
jgi:hypothetical protein